MVRTTVGGLIGAVLGGIIFFPPAVPLSFTLTIAVGGQVPEVAIPTALEFIFSMFWILPLIGVIIGGIVGVLIGKYRVYRVIEFHYQIQFHL